MGTSQSFLGPFNTRDDSLHNAVSEDAARIYWTATASSEPSGRSQGGNEPGKLYLRLNPTQPQSALEHGSATGKGDLIGPAKGTGNTTVNSEFLTKVIEETAGTFAKGQEITDDNGGIPAGTKIVAIAEEPLTEKEKEEGKPKRFKFTLSAKATKFKTGAKLTGLASEVVSNLSTDEGGAFEVGQKIAGAGIAFGTTIVSCAPECGPAATSLTLSAPATQDETGTALSATSPCTEAEAACTLAVSEEAEALSKTNTSVFLSAASDGSVAIFSTGEDLYEFDLAKALAGEAATSLIAHEVLGIMGVSEDATRVYLLSKEELEGEGEAGKPNLYLYERGAGTSFIATLGGADDASIGEETQVSSSIAGYAAKRVSRVSADGLHAAFTSADPALADSVAGYDNLDSASGRADREVYLYDATGNGGAGSLVCASCNPSGARPAGRATEQPNNDPANDVWSAATIPGWVTSLHPGNALSADGSRLFFESFEPLVGRDTNGLGDVYEWERVEGSEEEARKECLQRIGGERYLPDSGGCLSLISSGQASGDADLIDASADGRDVFFRTNADLLPQDTDFQDIYDAREGGGFPPPPEPEPECEGDACQSPAAPPNDPTPASSAFAGAGNVVEAPVPRPKTPCAKPRHRVKGRCITKHRKKKAHERHKRSHRRHYRGAF